MEGAADTRTDYSRGFRRSSVEWCADAPGRVVADELRPMGSESLSAIRVKETRANGSHEKLLPKETPAQGW
jgi:hypothetical protein